MSAGEKTLNPSVAIAAAWKMTLGDSSAIRRFIDSRLATLAR